MTTHVVVMGVSGSGKSTVAEGIAERLGWTFAEADEFHPQENIDKMTRGIPLDDEDRAPWLRDLAAWMAERATKLVTGRTVELPDEPDAAARRDGVTDHREPGYGRAASWLMPRCTSSTSVIWRLTER